MAETHYQKYGKAYYEANKEKTLARQHEYYLANKAKCCESRDRYDKTHPEVRKRIAIKYRASHLEACRQRNREWYRKNKEYYCKKRKADRINYYQNNKSVILKKNQLYHEKNKAAISAKQKVYCSKNKAKRAAQLKAWHLANKNNPKYKAKRLIQWRINESKRRALKRNAVINLRQINEWMRRIKSLPSFVCYYCSDRLPISLLHFDHIIALSKGGAHSVENLCTACGDCNRKKSNKSIQAWVRIDQQVMAL